MSDNLEVSTSNEVSTGKYGGCLKCISNCVFLKARKVTVTSHFLLDCSPVSGHRKQHFQYERYLILFPFNYSTSTGKRGLDLKY